MSLTPAQLRNLNDRIGWLLDKHLAPMFKPGTQLTFIARTPGNDDADVLVTSERDINNVVALALRSLGRAAIGQGMDLVPRTAPSACRDDGRCQQAIDYGTEGMSNGQCPNGQCVHAAGVDLPDGGQNHDR